jgi:GAF domain-containing protein
VPVRLQGTLLGYLWLIDDPEPVSDTRQQAAVRCATEAGVELYRTRRLESHERAREAELTSEPLHGSDDTEEVAAQLHTALLTPGSSYVAVVRQPVHLHRGVQRGVVRVRLPAARAGA